MHSGMEAAERQKWTQTCNGWTLEINSENYIVVHMLHREKQFGLG